MNLVLTLWINWGRYKYNKTKFFRIKLGVKVMDKRNKNEKTINNVKFKFLSPSSYDLFFQVLREGKYKTFKSKIEAELEEI